MSFDWAVAAPIDLAQLSLEELMEIEVVTASRKEESLFEGTPDFGEEEEDREPLI